MDKRITLLKVSATWVWLLFGPAVMVSILSSLWGTKIEQTLQRLYIILGKQPYLTSFIEIVFVGLLPLIFTIAGREDLRRYGFRRKGLVKSIVLSTPIATAITLVRGIQLKSYNIPFPQNMFYSALTLLAYGPLETFFVVWLIENTETLMDSEKKISDALLLVVSIYGLSHAFCITCLNIAVAVLNALIVTLVLLALTAIYRYTGNIYGFILAWTIINRQSLLAAIEYLT